MKKLAGILYFLSTLLVAYAQQPLEITLLSDAADEGDYVFEESLKREINALLAPRFDLKFTEVYTGRDLAAVNNAIAEVYANEQADILIGAGLVSGKLLAEQPSYPIPSITAIQLINSPNTTSGVSNFTYTESPFELEAGLEVLQEICGGQKIAVLVEASLSSIGINEEQVFPKSEAEISWIDLKDNLNLAVSEIPDDVEGVYILSPLSAYPTEEVKAFFAQLNERQLPSFTLFDLPAISLGAYAAFTTSDNIQKIPRRVALNVEKITEGKDPKDFPVGVETFTKQLVINMETVNKLGIYPKWTLLDNALLVNINKPSTTRVLNLKAAIAEGIQNNLGYQIESKQTQISDKEIDLAKSNYLPQLDVESTGLFLDQNSVDASFGSRGSFNWTAGASFSQLILSEPALANIAIQKLLYESQQQAQKQSELDVILEVAERYFNYLQVLSVADLQNNNIKAINQNLTIAKDKERVGYSGASDVYRWQTELDLAKTDLYETNAQLKSVGFQLNETLNRPIDEVFTIEGTENIDRLIEGLGQVFLSLIEDRATLEQLADFMVNESLQNLPETRQIQLAIAAQERLLKSNKRSFYLPTVAFGAGYENPVSIVNPGASPPIPDFEANTNPTWNAAFRLSFPLVAGGSRRFQKQKTEVELYQLQDQQKDINNLLELQVRANVELVNASYNNIRLTRSAAEAARKNIGIVQDLYKSGQVNVVTLVDAQNALLSAQINATNAAYQFMIDYFTLQRSIGNYIFLDTQEQSNAFFQRFLNFKTN
mgnify:CR=1 FL=1